MEKFTALTGVAAPLPMVNIDTDQIIPKQFLKTIKRTGLGQHLFAPMRYRADGDENPDFVLNRKPYRDARIIVGGANFGCGSSREHAPWALLDFGVRCVIAPSFADIFFNNCFKNGILAIALEAATVDRLLDDIADGADATLTVDLDKQTITRPGGSHAALRSRSVPQALPARRSRRDRPDAAAGRRDRRLRDGAARHPAVALRPRRIALSAAGRRDSCPSPTRSS